MRSISRALIGTVCGAIILGVLAQTVIDMSWPWRLIIVALASLGLLWAFWPKLPLSSKYRVRSPIRSPLVPRDASKSGSSDLERVTKLVASEIAEPPRRTTPPSLTAFLAKDSKDLRVSGIRSFGFHRGVHLEGTENVDMTDALAIAPDDKEVGENDEDEKNTVRGDPDANSIEVMRSLWFATAQDAVEKLEKLLSFLYQETINSGGHGYWLGNLVRGEVKGPLTSARVALLNTFDGGNKREIECKMGCVFRKYVRAKDWVRNLGELPENQGYHQSEAYRQWWDAEQKFRDRMNEAIVRTDMEQLRRTVGMQTWGEEMPRPSGK